MNHAFHLHANAVLEAVVENREQIDCADFAGRHFPLDVDVKLVLLSVRVLIKLAKFDDWMRERVHRLVHDVLVRRVLVGEAILV